MKLLRTALLLALFAVPARSDEVTGVVLDAQGQPVAGATLRLETGWARYTLTSGFDRWLGVTETRTGKSDDKGQFRFADLPEGAVVTILATTGQGVGVVQGAGKLEIRLGAPGSVRGKVTGKNQDKKGVRIFVLGGHGLGHGEGTLDKKTGAYRVGGLAPGPGRVFVKANNFDMAIHDVVIESGKAAKVKNTKARAKYLATGAPLVDCITAKLVDSTGKPVPGVQLTWSSRWMSGGMNSDKAGIVKLAGGAVAIGGPPYLLHITFLRGKERSFGGVFKKVKRGIALVECHPVHRITGKVTKGETPLTHFTVLAVGPDKKSPRVFGSTVADGGFTILLPAGEYRLVIGTPDGKRHEKALGVQGAATANFAIE